MGFGPSKVSYAHHDSLWLWDFERRRNCFSLSCTVILSRLSWWLYGIPFMVFLDIFPSPGDKMELLYRLWNPEKLVAMNHSSIFLVTSWSISKTTISNSLKVSQFAPPFWMRDVSSIKGGFPRPYETPISKDVSRTVKPSFPAKSPIFKAWAVMGLINLAGLTAESVYPLAAVVLFGGKGFPLKVAITIIFCGVRVLKSSGFDIDIRFGNCVAPREWIKVSIHFFYRSVDFKNSWWPSSLGLQVGSFIPSFTWLKNIPEAEGLDHPPKGPAQTLGKAWHSWFPRVGKSSPKISNSNCDYWWKNSS